MRNVMIVDGAVNCAYDVFAADDADFELFFPEKGQDIAFINEIAASNPKPILDAAFTRLWSRPVAKPLMVGLHGTIFYELSEKKRFYPNRRDSDLTQNGSRARTEKD